MIGFSNHPLRACNPVMLALQLVVRAIRTEKGTTALGKDGRSDLAFGVRSPIQQVIGGQHLTIQVLYRCKRSTVVVPTYAEGASRYRVDISTTSQPFQKE
jgi:hypothetical protein